jgi:tetratricopeptide (TPR) repeat protein
MKTKKHILLLMTFIGAFAFTAFGIAKISRDVQFEYAKYKYIATKNPQDPWAHFNLAITYAYMGKVEEGLKELGAVEKLDKAFAPKAIEKYSQMLVENPTNWQARFRLAFAYYFGKDRDKAIAELKKIVADPPLDGKTAWAYGYMAVIYGEQEKWDEAITACQKGLDIEPDAAAIHLAYAQALVKKGRTFQAAGEALTAFRLRGDEQKAERESKAKY